MQIPTALHRQILLSNTSSFSPSPVRTVVLGAGHGHGAPPLALAQPLHNLTHQGGAQITFI